jgi:hypothetical protein
MCCMPSEMAYHLLAESERNVILALLQSSAAGVLLVITHWHWLGCW